jgi:hypothetical protein
MDRQGTFLTFRDRLSDSPFVERIWRCHSEREDIFHSIAACHFEMVVTRYRGKAFLTLRGPETRATTIGCPAEGEWLGIRFKLGVFMPKLLPAELSDRRDVTLPGASGRSFWLNGSAWEYPDFENVETFVKWLVEDGVLARDSIVEAVLGDDGPALTLRSAQRHFLQATGLTRSKIRQIERARYAANLLKQGSSILDAVHEAGYFDHGHLARSLKYLIGQTPTEIMQGKRQLSFLYKTDLAQ